MKRSGIPWCLMLLAACTSQDQSISSAIANQFDSDPQKTIDVSIVGPKEWDRVCVLTPYTINEQTKTILGLEWDSDSKTSIAGSDGINVLVFVKGSEVVGYAEHPRNKGDFSEVAPKCVGRSNAKFVRNSEDDWAYLKVQA